MWARVSELFLGLWLAASPLVFRGADEPRPWLHELACALLVATFALAAYHRALRRAHLLILPVGAWLVGRGWYEAFFHEPTPVSQNRILVGFLLLMFAIVPSRASTPPSAWRDHYSGRDEEA